MSGGVLPSLSRYRSTGLRAGSSVSRLSTWPSRTRYCNAQSISPLLRPRKDPLGMENPSPGGLAQKPQQHVSATARATDALRARIAAPRALFLLPAFQLASHPIRAVQAGPPSCFCMSPRLIFAVFISKMVIFQTSRIGVALSRPSVHSGAVVGIDVDHLGHRARPRSAGADGCEAGTDQGAQARAALGHGLRLGHDLVLVDDRHSG